MGTEDRRVKARRLARIAEQRGADGVRSPKARRALRTLCRMAEDDRWLVAVFDAFMDEHRVYSARHGGFAAVRLTPTGSVERAFLSLYTEQLAEYDALDPDGSLIAKAYPLASEATRDELRRILVTAGMLHVVRLLPTVGGRRGVQDMSEEEIGDLARLLAEHGEWAQLWRLVRDAPVAAAVTAMPLFGTWRPTDPADAELFDRFSVAGPATVTSVVQRSLRRIGSGGSREASFAPDLSEIAVAYEKSITVYGLHDGQPVVTYKTRPFASDLLHLGDGTVVYVVSKGLARRLVRQRRGQPEEVLADGLNLDLARTPSGFVVATGTSLRLGTAAGPLGAKVDLEALGLDGWLARIAGDPVAGLLAIAASDGTKYGVVLLTADLEPLARGTVDDRPWGLHVSGPDHVLTWGSERGTLRSWRREGTSLTVATECEDAFPESVRMELGVPVRRNVSVLAWYDPATLEQVAGPPGHRSSDAPTPALSRHRDFAASEPKWTWPRVGLEVRDLRLCELVDLIRWPIAKATPAMLHTVAALEGEDLDDEAAALLRAFRAAVEYRLGTDVALGSLARRRADDDDIALGGG
ncbi:hypothetical protein ACTMTJ_08625 [Phytohabitans sp. LJ34]|uniref:hypothetical protein n=1 Tax=Phytohabitans sp. LJ34 TaxID=3452217 RepID=UPI003F8C5186